MSSDWVEVQIEYKPGLTACYQLPPGYVIVPAGDVPTPEDRAAVGRLVELEQARIDMRVAASRGSSQSDWDAANTAWHAAKEAIQPNDIEAARRVAEGGK